MGKVIVLDPSVARKVDNAGRGPDFGDLQGRVVGFRVDTLWKAWDQVVDVWARHLQAQGAEVIYWRTHQGRSGAEGIRIAAEEAAFMAKADVVVSGLGNCGSCTGWTVRDAIAARDHGLAVVAVMTQPFEALSESIARRAGHSGLRRLILPHPLNELPEPAVREIAAQYLDRFLALAGVAAGGRAAELSELSHAV